MTLWAISDLHVGYEANRRAVEALPAYPGDWLILGGDTGDTPAQLQLVLDVVTARFERVIWVPGNHDLWTPRQWPDARRGAAHYERLVDQCRRAGVVTPEDPFIEWPGDTRAVVAPCFTLYDYSFAPAGMAPASAVAWAAEAKVQCADEVLLAPPPYPTREAWCAARVAVTEARLAAVPTDLPIVLVNHFPLRPDLAVLPRIPRFTIWCGTTRTAEWHTRFRLQVVVSGHLHMRSTRWRAGVRFEEVSLGYPAQWRQDQDAGAYLRQILPEPTPTAAGWGEDRTVVRHY
ncbi:MAG TPA: metallophosphoesterase [Vicinamibacterales bacterium]|nr:metallophosphoesterase [Vicinamibacterales bacterium]